MRKSYYIFVVAHSIGGRIRRLHVPYYSLYLVGLLALVGTATVFGAAASYMRMLFKVANYNHLRRESEVLRRKYTELQSSMSNQGQQLASLQSLAKEVSLAYGLKQVTKKPGAPVEEDSEQPIEFRASVEQYQMLLRATVLPQFERQNLLDDRWLSVIPALWPVEGPLTAAFGDRLDPFKGEGAFHAGVDISSQYGTPVRAAADGIVALAERTSGYGLRVDIQHSRGLETRYAHLSGMTAVPGQAVKSGELIGYVGRSGRTTGAHLHYEVRVHDTPVNPIKYMSGAPRRRVARLGIREMAPTHGLGTSVAEESFQH